MSKLLVGRSLVAVSAVAIALATLTPNAGALPPFNPFCILCGEYGSVDLVLNVLLFLPLGVGLAMVGSRPFGALGGMFAASAAIELLQLLLIPGRDPTVRDVVMNSVGGALGFAIGTHRESLLWPTAPSSLKLLVGWSVAWLALQAVAGYSLVPEPTRSRYYGQIGRDLGDIFSAFPGEILKPAIDSLAIPDSDISTDQVRGLVSRPQGALVQALVIPKSCPTRLAGIVRIADAEAREILVLAEDDASLFFGVRTGAEVLRLRPIRYRLHHVFGRGSVCEVTGDTILLQARYTRRHVFLRAVATGGVAEETIAPSLSQGWRLFVPVQTYIEASLWTASLSAMWLFLLMLPVGYWGFVAARPNRFANTRPIAVVSVFVVAVMMTGFVAVPAIFGIPTARPWEGTAAVAGVVTGLALARLRLRSRSTIPHQGD